MENGRRAGRPDQELFINNDPDVPETPTVAPLRVYKPANTASPPPTTAYSSPNSSTTSPPPSLAHAYGQPATSPPTRPLPYPENGQAPSPGDQQEGGGLRLANGSPPANNSYPYPMPTYPTNSAGQQQSALAARRGNVLKPLPDSPGPETPDKEDLFQRPIRMSQRLEIPPGATNGKKPGDAEPQSAITEVAYNYYGHTQPPKPGLALATSSLAAPTPRGPGVNRLASTSSVSTTKGSRGSPPPPETPVDYPAGGIEARYAAAGIAGESTLSALQAQSLASQQRQAQYSTPTTAPAPTPVQPPQPQPQQNPPRRPWTPTEDPGTAPHGPALSYQGDSQAVSPPRAPAVVTTAAAAAAPAAALASPRRTPRESALEQDMHGLQLSDEPPPAYSSLSNAASGYPDEKGRQPQTIAAAKAQAQAAAPGEPGQAAAVAAGAAVAPNNQDHPMFANHPSLLVQSNQPQPSATPNQSEAQAAEPIPSQSPPPSQASPGRTSPPPLPEGWIAHMDPNSGQYYYIHLPTQSTQWEFPKGPTPLSLNEVPSSPTGTFVNPFASPTSSKFPIMQPMASPGFSPQQTPFGQDSASLGGLSSPTAAGFSHIPPVAGHEQYRIAPTNGVYFGPYLRYTNMDVDNGVWFGSVLLITDAPSPPTIHLHQSVDLSPNREYILETCVLALVANQHIARQLKANHIYQHRRFGIYRYDIDIRMEDVETRWTYAITSHLGCTRYEFVVAGRHDSGWRFIAHSGNDFALNVNANERARLGGVGLMWKDILQKHQEVGGFHAQLGMGNQIYADRLWKEVALLRQWTATSGKENRKNAAWTPQHEEEVTHAYFHFYTSHLDQPLLREAFAQIPHVLTLDDHEM